MKGFKTFAFGLIVALLPLLNYLNNSDIFSQFITDPKTQKLVFFMIGAMIIVLRAVTNTPMFQQSGFKADETAPVITETPTETTTADAPVTDNKGA